MPVEITVQGILFDMDGTLVDSTAAVELTMGEWAQKQGVVPQVFFDQSHGVRTQDNVKRFQTVPVLGSSLSEAELAVEVKKLETLIAHNGAVLAAGGGRGIDALPGMHALLNALRDGGARFGLVTSATSLYADSALVTAKVGPLPFRITGDQCVNGKPHPEPFLKGLEALKLLPGPPITASRVLVFEDAPSGLAAGLAAGCKTLAVCTSQTRERILSIEATYRVVDLTRVEVLAMDTVKGEITLRLNTLEEETQ